MTPKLPALRRREPFFFCSTPPARRWVLGAGVLLGGGYLILHLWSLSWFPFVHSDEAWLASLSRTMFLEGRVDATEEFFRLTPRHPHALKTLFHLVQAPFVLLSWSVVAARIPSLLAGLATVGLLAVAVRRMTGSRVVAGAVAAGLALDVQFFYASHFARQEVFVLLALTGALWAVVRGSEAAGTGENVHPARSAAIAGGIIGLTIFVHPNAFIAALAISPWVAMRGGRSGWLRALGIYGAILVAGAALAVGASFLMDPNFGTNYLAFGGSVGVTAGLPERIARLGEYFIKLARGYAGTYYLAPVAPQLWALAAVTAASIAVSLISRYRGRTEAVAPAGLSALFTLLAIFIIGKYSPPIVVFFFPWLYLQMGLLLDRCRRYLPRFAIVLLLLIPIASGAQFVRELSQWYPGSYDRYLARIRAAIPEGDVALANLNAAFAFEPGDLRVWRDLGSLPARPEGAAPSPEAGTSPNDPLLERGVGQFLRQESVKWVVLPVEELEIIYRSRPVWNDVYGNPHRFYPDLQEILTRYGTRTDRFEAPRYAMRLVPYIEDGPHHVEIYRLDLP